MVDYLVCCWVSAVRALGTLPEGKDLVMGFGGVSVFVVVRLIIAVIAD